MKEKKWYFKSAEEASLFQLYVATLNTSGDTLSKLFHDINISESLKITSHDLLRCQKFGIHLSEVECVGMIDLVSNKKHYAMKIQTKLGLLDCYSDDMSRVDFEKQAFASCQHPFIINLDYAFQTDNLVIMALGLCTGKYTYFVIL